jgi:hypothetical protein
MPVMTLAEATAIVQRQTAWDQNPAVPLTDLQDIVNQTLRASYWQASTQYYNNDKVLPTVKNGHVYVAIRSGGVSGTVEPAWPEDVLWNSDFLVNRTDASRHVRILDGTVTWEETGVDWEDNYDINLACHKIWMQKAALAAKLMAVQTGRSSFELGTIYEHCRSMARAYKVVRFA